MTTTTPSQLLTPELQLAQHTVLEKLEKIEAGLKTHDPMIEHHCKTIRAVMLDFEELVHILPDERIRVLMVGMKHWTNIQLVKEVSKTRGKGKVTADDL